MSTYRNQREVYETARGIAQVFKAELEHCQPVFDLDEWYDDQVFAAADRECIYTQDNWDVCNLFRCSPEFDMADEVPMSEFESIDQYFAYVAYNIWCQLIREALDA